MMALAAQTSILSTVIVALVIIAIVAWIIRGMIQKKKRSVDNWHTHNHIR